MRGKKVVNLIFKQDKLNFTSFHVWYKFKAASQQLLESLKDRRMTGFRFSWRIDREIDVTPKYKEPLLADMVQLAKQLRLQENMTSEQIWEKMIRDKAKNVTTLEEAGMCEKDQIIPKHLSIVHGFG